MDELTEEILRQALQFRVDDIHLLPFQNEYRFYLRDGGKLTAFKTIDPKLAERWISYLKYAAGMDVAETRRPQSGALRYTLKNGEMLELRLSVIVNFKQMPSLVIRLLPVDVFETQEETVGSFFPQDLLRLEHYLRYKSGLLLFSGPVSSGKTTTIYHLLRNRVNKMPLQVITMEEPVEITEPQFLQTEINEKAGISYELLIKSALRHHPDMMLIGEIRDEVTAKMVIRGALTGHLMIATVHAKDCSGVISRLEELGVTRNLLQQTLVAIVAQRLIPTFCPFCGGDCRLHCSHVPLAQKKETIFDIADGQRLQELLHSSSPLTSSEEHTMNRKLRKAYGLGYISKNSFEAYKIY